MVVGAPNRTTKENTFMINTNLLIKALTKKVQSNGDGETDCFINVMNNNDKSFFDKSNKNAMQRMEHNFAHITYIPWMDYGNGFKGFGDRKWAYVVQTSNPNLFQIRKDVLDAWKSNSAKDEVIVISNEDNTVYFFSMEDFRGGKPSVSWSYKWNEEGNIICAYDHWTARFTFTDKNPEEVHPYAAKLSDGFNYLGHVVYSKYRTKRMILVGKYDENGKLVNFHKMKSISMAYDMLHLGNNGSLRTVQRMLNKNLSVFLTSESGTKYYITFCDITNTCPKNWSDEKVTVETVDEFIDEETVITDVENIIVNIDNIDENILCEEINRKLEELPPSPRNLSIAEMALLL